MVIFNSYVELPEGSSKPDAENSAEHSFNTHGTTPWYSQPALPLDIGQQLLARYG